MTMSKACGTICFSWKYVYKFHDNCVREFHDKYVYKFHEKERIIHNYDYE